MMPSLLTYDAAEDDAAFVDQRSVARITVTPSAAVEGAASPEIPAAKFGLGVFEPDAAIEAKNGRKILAIEIEVGRIDQHHEAGDTDGRDICLGWFVTWRR
jgi:hypothetical protein